MVDVFVGPGLIKNVPEGGKVLSKCHIAELHLISRSNSVDAYGQLFFSKHDGYHSYLVTAERLSLTI